LAVLLTERGLGGDDTDLAHRLQLFRSERSRRANDARGLARRWGGEPQGDDAIGAMLGLAYPDRVAQQSGARGRFRLANGRAASLDETDALAKAPFIVVTDMTGAAATTRIRGAAAIAREEIEALFAAHITGEVALHWDEPSKSVKARRRRSYQALVLGDDPIAVPQEQMEAAADLLARQLAPRLPWSRAQRDTQARIDFLRRTAGADWPDLSALPPEEIARALLGRTSSADITADDLDGLLATVLPWQKAQEAERALPTHFTAPTGNRFAIDYAAEAGPSVELRVQELYGLTEHPSVAQGRVPLVLVLTSPAHRPIQTTRDLPGFWRGSWKDVQKDMRGRYPRHPWPDDPANAAPTSRAKPRGT
ncbi:MAG: ATP-dependent helicase C-terminal domain-containing protein, partial [Devosia sp.]